MTVPPVQFVGAGPGAEDLITLRGASALEAADVVVYAGSLVNPAHLGRCRSGCALHDSAHMDLKEQVDVMTAAALSGKKVVRLHTGDPSMYGAIAEQMEALSGQNVPYEVVPGVSSVFGAAAALGCELTYPGVSQSVVLTRTAGRTPMPGGETPSAFARTGAMLVFFLSVGNMESLVGELTGEGGLDGDTPASVVYRATWPDQKIVRGTLADIAGKVQESGIGRQALIFVGRALEASGNKSLLYAKNFSHGYRNTLSSEDFRGACALYAFTEKGLIKAREIAAGLGKNTMIFSPRAAVNSPGEVRVESSSFDRMLSDRWKVFAGHVFVGATGIAVRKIAPLLGGKTSDPAVVCCTETGAHIVSLLSGHLGGANRLARRVARITGGEAVIGTATDLNGLTSFDEAAALEHAEILNPSSIKALNAALLEGRTVAFHGPERIYKTWFRENPAIKYAGDAAAESDEYAVLWDRGELSENSGENTLHIRSSSFVLGVGCRRGTDIEALKTGAEALLKSHGLSPARVARLASCDLKADEPALLKLAESWGVPVDFYPAETLSAIETPTPSETVREKIGTASVAEASALLASGGRMTVPKTKGEGMTFALAAIPQGKKPVSRSVRPGRVVVVGLGSGSPGQITPEVEDCLSRCDVVAGYTKYIDLVRSQVHGKELIQSGMLGEVERCRAALETAAGGKEVCMVCSGDPGILAMAGLLFELRSREPEFAEVELKVLPGITAANIAAAALGAPLQNGFSLISLSDLLVPSDEVRRNLRAAVKGALPVVLYNPAGRKRRHLMEEAVDLFREERGGETLCAYVRHAGRPAEEKWVGTLDEFPRDEVDMSTVIVIGGPRTKRVGDSLYEARGYEEKYLANQE